MEERRKHGRRLFWVDVADPRPEETSFEEEGASSR